MGTRRAAEFHPDPDIVVIDPSFRQYLLGITAIHRVVTGFQWAEGPAWSSQGQYLVFSDVQGDTQYRFLWDDRRVTPFRKPSYNSNGNSFDFQGRQISAQDFYRRVVRWEHDGTMTVIADPFEGKPLNSPNDLVPHPDGSIWFTDPPYGDTLSEGHPDEPAVQQSAGSAQPADRRRNRRPARSPNARLPTAVYRWDPSGRLEVVVTEDQLPDPNGICFSHPTTRRCTWSAPARAGRCRTGRHAHDLCVRRAGHARSPTSGCSPT